MYLAGAMSSAGKQEFYHSIFTRETRSHGEKQKLNTEYMKVKQRFVRIPAISLMQTSNKLKFPSCPLSSVFNPVEPFSVTPCLRG
ncbi:MAG: hypothetical protein DMG61_11450 [Acidobacteria bacterium]|nr:MAG: hypothetical protein DMG61_11450 [Acidobacteriota bacterium]PYY19203.1 MAG: hypothetical protein DMG60_05260 [Acidobacteriota bacterium]